AVQRLLDPRAPGRVDFRRQQLAVEQPQLDAVVAVAAAGLADLLDRPIRTAERAERELERHHSTSIQPSPGTTSPISAATGAPRATSADRRASARSGRTANNRPPDV